MDNRKVINIEGRLLKPMKEDLEKSLDRMIKSTLMADRDTEVSLKIAISTYREYKSSGETYTVPLIQYKISEKIKEPKADYKGQLGSHLSIELDEEDNIIIKNVEKQLSLFEEDADEEQNEEIEEDADEDNGLWRK